MMPVGKNPLALIILASALFFCAVAAQADTIAIKVGYKHQIDATLLSPDGPGPYPAILLLPGAAGREPADLDFAQRLVQQGYVVLVPANLNEYGSYNQARNAMFTTFAQAIYDDQVASLERLRAAPKVSQNQIAVIGFDAGGYFALWLAASRQVQAGISYYGELTGVGSDPSLGRFRQAFTHASAPVLILYGCEDAIVSIDDAVELDTLLDEVQVQHVFYQYAGAEHRFERTAGADNQAATLDAWQRTLNFLSTSLNP